MTDDQSLSHGLPGVILELVNSEMSFTDLHIEQDAPMMIKAPRGWQAVGNNPVSLTDMRPLLNAIDQDWEDKIMEGAIDRPLILTQCRLRCNVYRMASGEKVTVSIRRFPLIPVSLEKTGLPAYVKTLLEATRGMILVTGPTGSGKTTTVTAMLDYLNSTRSAHIITIEEPIEYRLERKQSIISQKEVPTDTPTFFDGLRDAMRQKPDVLMVGEIRDFETADTLLHACESGHLVLATMHTNSAVSAINKLLSFFKPEQRDQRALSLAHSLVGVICQSLLPNEAGNSLVLASEMIFNNNQQASQFVANPEKLHLLADFMRRKTDNMSRSLNDALTQLVAKKVVSPKDAMRAAYNRMELHEQINSLR